MWKSMLVSHRRVKWTWTTSDPSKWCHKKQEFAVTRRRESRPWSRTARCGQNRTTSDTLPMTSQKTGVPLVAATCTCESRSWSRTSCTPRSSTSGTCSDTVPRSVLPACCTPCRSTEGRSCPLLAMSGCTPDPACPECRAWYSSGSSWASDARARAPRVRWARAAWPSPSAWAWSGSGVPAARIFRKIFLKCCRLDGREATLASTFWRRRNRKHRGSGSAGASAPIPSEKEREDEILVSSWILVSSLQYWAQDW